jgi:hypothetical protein
MTSYERRASEQRDSATHGADHGVLAADLIARERVVGRELSRVGEDVEVGHRGLDHDDVGALGDVPHLIGVNLGPSASTVQDARSLDSPGHERWAAAGSTCDRRTRARIPPLP